jgi:hypothetical protein
MSPEPMEDLNEHHGKVHALGKIHARSTADGFIIGRRARRNEVSRRPRCSVQAQDAGCRFQAICRRGAAAITERRNHRRHDESDWLAAALGARLLAGIEPQ